MKKKKNNKNFINNHNNKILIISIYIILIFNTAKLSKELLLLPIKINNELLVILFNCLDFN